jgi:signal transduction histidine kinase
MPSPYGKKSFATRFTGTSGSLFRLPHRKLAHHPKPSRQSRALATSNSPTEPLAASTTERQLRHPSAATLNETSVGQSYGSEVFLQAIVEACASSVAVLDELGQILYVSKPWQLAAEEYDRRGGDQALNLNCFERRNPQNAGYAIQNVALAEDIQAILDGTITEFHDEYSCRSVSGTKWFEVHVARLDLPGTHGAFRVLVNSSDITHARQTEETLRDLGGRLITAQEEERSRVARELHDDLNQRMALLSVELEQLSQRLPVSQNNLRSSINNVWERAQEISTEIHRVAYQLHPSKLDHLGLVAAVNSHCHELAALHQIEINFKEQGCGGFIPKDVTLCLFRIIQEAFRNVIKHSGAREASVALEGTSEFIHLSISDNGRGFDVDRLESKNGLGLISMRERLRLVGGAISIQSTSRGTKIEVSVPTSASHTAGRDSPIFRNGVVPLPASARKVGLLSG